MYLALCVKANAFLLFCNYGSYLPAALPRKHPGTRTDGPLTRARLWPARLSTIPMATSSDVELQIADPPSDPALDELASTHAAYTALCRQAAILKTTTGFHDMEVMDVVRQAGLDKQGRPVFLFTPGNLSRGADLERVTMFCLTLMHELVVVQGKAFGCVWLCNNLWDSQLGFLFFRRTYKMLPRPYRKNMHWLRIVHPPVQARVLLFALSYLLKDSFWEKFDYADRIEFLDEVVDVPGLRIPKEYFDYDRMLDQEARHMTDPSNPHGVTSESVMGGMMGGGVGMMGGGGLGPSMDGMGSMGGMDGMSGAWPDPAAPGAAPHPREEIWSEDEDGEDDDEPERRVEEVVPEEEEEEEEEEETK